MHRGMYYPYSVIGPHNVKTPSLRASYEIYDRMSTNTVGKRDDQFGAGR